MGYCRSGCACRRIGIARCGTRSSRGTKDRYATNWIQKLRILRGNPRAIHRIRKRNLPPRVIGSARENLHYRAFVQSSNDCRSRAGRGTHVQHLSGNDGLGGARDRSRRCGKKHGRGEESQSQKNNEGKERISKKNETQVADH